MAARPVSSITIELSDQNEAMSNNELVPCIRTLCEAEDGWHLSTTIVPIKEISSFCSYLSRIMRILKNGNISNQMNIFSTDQGSKLIKEIEDKSLSDEKDVCLSYFSLRNHFLSFLSNSFEQENEVKQTEFLELKRCELKNHKIVWLCDRHITSLNPTILKDSGKNLKSGNDDEYKLLDEMESLDLNLYSAIEITN